MQVDILVNNAGLALGIAAVTEQKCEVISPLLEHELHCFSYLTHGSYTSWGPPVYRIANVENVHYHPIAVSIVLCETFVETQSNVH